MNKIWLSSLFLLSPVLFAQDFFFRTEYLDVEVSEELQDKINQRDAICAESGSTPTVLLEVMKSNRPLVDAIVNGDLQKLRENYQLFQQESLNFVLDLKQENPEHEFGFAECAHEWRFSVDYIGHYKNMEQFTQSEYHYSGGAHGIYATAYHVVEADDSFLELDELVTDSEALLDALIESYLKFKSFADLEEWRSSELNCCIDIGEGEDERQAFRKALLVRNFFFDEHGLNFSYPPYAVSSYSDGEVVLTLGYESLKGIIAEKYLP